MTVMTYSLILPYDGIVELMGTFRDLRACIAHSVAEGIGGICVATDLLEKFVQFAN